MTDLSFSNPLVRGALAGFISALAVDINAFKADNMDWAHFNLKIAAKRWLIGAALGAIAALGIQTSGMAS